MEKSQIRHIQSLMESLGFTKATLAEKCGLSKMTIHRILTNTRYNPTQKTIQAIADALEVNEQDILQRSEETSTKVKINGYIDYLGQITRIETIKQLKAIYKRIIDDEAASRQVKDIKAKEKGNRKSQNKTLDIQGESTITVIFDFDGTLIDTRPLERYLLLFKGKKRFSEEWKQGMEEYLSHIKDCHVYEGIAEVIDYIRQNNIRTCVVTASIKEKAKRAIEVNGWKDVFKAKNIYGRHAYGKGKVTKEDANPSLFKKALEDMGVSASECIAFGNEVEDTIAAQKLGIRAFNCAWGATMSDLKEMRERMPQITLYSPMQIIDKLKE